MKCSVGYNIVGNSVSTDEWNSKALSVEEEMYKTSISARVRAIGLSPEPLCIDGE